jgi:anti-anti-sigma factor
MISIAAPTGEPLWRVAFVTSSLVSSSTESAISVGSFSSMTSRRKPRATEAASGPEEMVKERVGTSSLPLCQVANRRLVITRIPSVYEGGNVTELRERQAPIEIRPWGEVLHVAGELDMSTTPALAEALGSVPDGVICVDMSEVPFMDSTGAHVLAKAAKELDDGCIIVHGARPVVAKVFQILGLTTPASNIHILDGHARG